MFYVYILHSATLDKFYVGASANPRERLKKHNRKHKGFTGTARDWEMVYREAFTEKRLARRREMEIKSKKSRSYIEYLTAQPNE